MTVFYLGTHEPRWLERSTVPLCVAVPRLARYRRTENLPMARSRWVLDSGGFSCLAKDGNWPWDPDTFGGMVYRFIDAMGRPPQWVTCQDFMCEEQIRASTGLSVRQHQELTVENFVYLREEFPHAPWMPVLQGIEPGEHLEHVAMYEAASVDLLAEPVVGVGSVCRLQATAAVEAVIRPLAARGLRLHGFGVKLAGLRRIGHLLDSADSMAWSKTARLRQIRLDGCTHSGVCASCPDWALRWRDRVLAALDQPRQLALFDMASWV